jgi:ASCH domain
LAAIAFTASPSAACCPDHKSGSASGKGHDARQGSVWPSWDHIRRISLLAISASSGARRGDLYGEVEDDVMTRRAVKALTIRQPWAWAVVYAGKDVENRRWRTSYRGPLLIHAGRTDDPAATARVLWTMADPGAWGQPRPAFEARGAIIGVANLAEVLTDSPSRWADSHQYHWVLESPAPLDRPVPCAGKPGLWTPPDAAMAAIADLL